MPTLVEIAKRQLTRTTHRIYTLPILTLMPHSRCNCRCVMCDIWKANREGREITDEALAPHMESFRKLGVRWVVLSGGEALMHANLWRLCETLKALGVKITLLSTGLLLARHAAECGPLVR
ncbi:MAG: radical SAM protein [Anaerolineae bacterium]|nr:radical SAM protein [Anaerolineae bacterium]